MSEWYELRNEVFRSRTEPYYWNLKNYVKCWIIDNLHNERTDASVWEDEDERSKEADESLGKHAMVANRSKVSTTTKTDFRGCLEMQYSGFDFCVDRKNCTHNLRFKRKCCTIDCWVI